ncbi:unnamed protein product [Closterium sp. NIES-54]
MKTTCLLVNLRRPQSTSVDLQGWRANNRLPQVTTLAHVHEPTPQVQTVNLVPVLVAPHSEAAPQLAAGEGDVWPHRRRRELQQADLLPVLLLLTLLCLLVIKDEIGIGVDRDRSSTSASALVAELVDFAAACRLDYAASLVAESESASVYPPSIERVPTPLSGRQPWTQMVSSKSTGTYVNEVPPPGANIVSGMWIFRVKRPSGSPPVFKARYVARGFSQQQGVDFFLTFSPTPKMTTLRVLLHVAAQRDYELHSLHISTAFLQGSLHKEIWLRRPPGFTGSFPAGVTMAHLPADQLGRGASFSSSFQRGQLHLAYLATRANTANIFTKALQPCDHQRFCTMLGCVHCIACSLDITLHVNWPCGHLLVLRMCGDVVIHPELALSFLTSLVTSCSPPLCIWGIPTCTNLLASSVISFLHYSDTAVYWSSSCIKCATLSSTESKYVAATDAGKEGRRLHFLLAEFKLFGIGKPTILRVDIKLAITVAEGLGLTDNLKYMEQRYAWLQHMVRRGMFVLKYIQTTEQPADFLTKALHFPAFNWCSVDIGQVRVVDVGDGDDDVQ